MKLRILFIVSLICSGCATTTLNNAESLATAGTKAANAIDQSVQETIKSMNGYVESSSLLVMTGRKPLSEDDIDKILDIVAMLEGRRKAAAALRNAYASLSALATYNAKGEVKEAFTQLAGSVNDYGAATGGETGEVVIDAPTAKILAMTGGLLAQRIQVKKIRKSSEVLGAAMGVLRKALENEKARHKNIRKVVPEIMGLATEALWDMGFGFPHEVIRSHLEGLGVTYDEKQALTNFAKLKANASDLASFKKGIGEVIKSRARMEAAAQVGSIDAAFSSLGTLQNQHAKLTAGQGLTLQGVNDALVLLRFYADQLTELRQLREERKQREREARQARNEALQQQILQALMATIGGQLPVPPGGGG